MSIASNLEKLLARRGAIEAALAESARLTPEEVTTLSRELAEIRPVAEQAERVKSMQANLAYAKGLLAEEGVDADTATLAQDEIAQLTSHLPIEERNLQLLLLPQDKDDNRGVILEIRAGTGGEEAALFAADLFAMYHRFASRYGWRFEVMGVSETGIGGYKEAVASITGSTGASAGSAAGSAAEPSVFARLKFESGVHRVQRIPETESGGRIHTSAATVAVLPEAESVDIDVSESDLRIDVFRSSGPGGQSVNTTDSAVRITHIPTGIVVSQQDEKSQHKNKAKAMKILRARLYDAERSKIEAERAESRKTQVGSGDRSGRIRTYNFPQNRVTDHRINLSLYKLDRIIAGEALDEVIDALIAEDQAARLAAADG